jgi:hypothetical protein
LSFDNELISGNLLKIRGWASQLVVISGNEDTSGHQLLLLKVSNSLGCCGPCSEFFKKRAFFLQGRATFAQFNST